MCWCWRHLRWVAGFQQGKVGVMPYPATLLATASQTVDVGLGPLPGVNGGESTFVGGDGIGVSKDSKSTEQAWNFLVLVDIEEGRSGRCAGRVGGDIVSRGDLADNRGIIGEGPGGCSPSTRSRPRARPHSR